MNKTKKEVIAYLHTHWDFEWYRSAQSFNIRLNFVTDKILQGLQDGSIPSFYFDGQVLALLNYLKYNKSKKNLIKKLIKDKKLFIGPFLASSDSFLSSDISLIKNLELGMKIAKEYNQNEFIGYLSDTFSHSEKIFEILKLFNIKNAILWRGVGDIEADFKAFNVNTTRLCRGYYHDILHSDLSLDDKAKYLKMTLDKIAKYSSDVILLPIGADHMAPLKSASDIIEKMNKRLDDYKITIKTPFEYIKSVKYKKEYNQEFVDNSSTYILQGIYSSRVSEKIKNRELEFNLFKKAYILNYFLKGGMDKFLEEASFELIKNQAHDSIYGCTTDIVNKMVQTRQIKIDEIIKEVEKNLIDRFKKNHLVSDNKENIGVFNLSNKNYSGIVKFISDKKIKNAQKIRTIFMVDDSIYCDLYKNPVTEDFHKYYEYIAQVSDIAPFSFKSIPLLKEEKRHTIGVDFIENSYIKLFVLNNTVCVLDKVKNKLYEDFIKIESTQDIGDSYNFCPKNYPESLKIKGVKIKTSGKIQSVLQIIFEGGIKLNFSLNNVQNLLFIESCIINKKKNRKLSLCFNLESPIKKSIVTDGFKKVERMHDSGYLLYEKLPAKDGKELNSGSFPLSGTVFANGVNFITMGLYEYETYKNLFKITLLRATGIISNPKNPARMHPAGPPVACPDMQEITEINENLAISFDEEFNEDDFFRPVYGICGEFDLKEKKYLKNYPKNAKFIGLFNNKPLFYENGFIMAK